MKKIFYLMSLCALAFVSCQKEELVDNNPFEGKYSYTFIVNQTAESKATIGDKDGAKWPVLWSEGDQLGVYAEGELLGVATMDAESAGKNAGTFTLKTDAELSNGSELYFSYPYVADAQMKTGKVAAEHTLTAAGIGANAVAYAYVDYAGANTEFTLTHVNAYLKFNLSSSEFAGYTLQGVTLWAAGAELSGDVQVGNGDAVTYKGTGDYVKTTLEIPVEMATVAQPVYLSALPGNLSGKTVYAIVHMTKGIETVTLPVKLGGAGNLPAGSVTEITLPSLTKSLAPKWYEPVETRYIAAYGKGWSYGPENTVLFTEDGQEKSIEVKARGNFMKVKQPAKIKVNNIHQDSGMISDAIFINDTDGNTTATFDLSSDYTFKAKMKINSSYGYFSSLLLQDASGNTIWGLTLWLLESGVITKDYVNGKVLDRNIGASGVSSVRKNYKCNGAYFQWGRPFGFTWSTKRNTTYALTDKTNTLEKSAANPYVMYCYSNISTGQGYPWDWYWGDGNNQDRSGDLDDLWGNPQKGKTDVTTSGTKSIYDPCPKGYRVVSAAVLNEVNSNLVAEYVNSEFKSTGETVVNTSSDNHHFLEYKGISWGFGGQFRPIESTSKPNGDWGKAGDGKIQYLAFWSNANNSQNGYELYFQMKDSKITRSDSRTKAAAAPIRCMVDTENR